MDYNAIISQHLRNAAYDILLQISQDGAPSHLQLFITFATQYPGVDIPERLREEYPEEMTIVLQYEFENMEVKNTHFSVSLVFDTEMESISIPFNALLHLQDPNGDLDLELEPIGIYDLTKETLPASTHTSSASSQTKPAEGKVIDLNQFRE